MTGGDAALGSAMPAAPPCRERFYDSGDGLALYFRDYGAEHSGRLPVLCLHGLTRNSKDFADLAARLSTSRRVLAPDLRGRGRSDYDPNWRNYRLSTYVTDIGRLLDTLRIERVVIIGTSLGGLTAMAMAVERSAGIAGIVLNDVGPEFAPEGLARIASYVGRLLPVTSWEEAAAQSRTLYGAALPHFDDAAWLRYAGRSYREDGDGIPRPESDPMIGAAVREAAGVECPAPWDMFAALAEVPMLVFRGELSDLLSIEIVERMIAAKPDLVSVTVSKRGHVPLLDEPECVEALDKFFRRLDGNTPLYRVPAENGA